MYIVQVYVGEKLIREFPDCYINTSENWTKVYPKGTDSNDATNHPLLWVCTRGRRTPNVSVIQIVQEEVG